MSNAVCQRQRMQNDVRLVTIFLCFNAAVISLAVCLFIKSGVDFNDLINYLT